MPLRIDEYFLGFSTTIWPTQLDICFSEKCNQECDYCFVKKHSNKKLNFSQIKKSLDVFFNLPPPQKTVTFNTSEPLLDFFLYKKTIEYILKNKKNGASVHIVTTTNGLNLNQETENFFWELVNDDDFRLNVSLDGTRHSHDQHRKIKGAPNSSAFDLLWRNLKRLPRNKIRIIFTITPDQVRYLLDNINFIFSHGFLNIDLFPQMFCLWSKDEQRQLQQNLHRIVKSLNRKRGVKYNLRVLNRLWGASDAAELFLGCDGKFYLNEWILPLSPKDRDQYQIGDWQQGIDFNHRAEIFARLNLAILHQTKGRCLSCRYKKFCALPLPLWLWTQAHKKSFDLFFDNFCALARIFIKESFLIEKRFRNKIDRQRILIFNKKDILT